MDALVIPRILSVAGPLFVYASVVLVAVGIYRERHRLDWAAVALAAGGVIASFALLTPVHRLFFDEDIYIHIASNLSRAPAAQITLLGGPDDIQVATYYKEPAGFPVLLSLVFVLTGPSESAAFAMARLLYGVAIAAVYLLARAVLDSRRQAIAAAGLFAAAPVCFWFSVSAGTDIGAALFAVLGMWGIVTGNGALAAGGLALAAQMRLETIVLVPLLLLPKSVTPRWKAIGAGLVVAELAHLSWVFSVAPTLAKAERVAAAFSASYLLSNLKANLLYLFNPFLFPAAVSALAILALANPKSEIRISHSAFRIPQFTLLLPWIALLSGVYLFFYAGSFQINPRYSIQILAPLALLAASLLRRPLALTALMLTLVLPYTRPRPVPDYIQALAVDHRLAVNFAKNLGPNDLVLSTEPEVFLNQGLYAMNAVFASERPERLDEQFHRYAKVWYHAGARTSVVESPEWRTDRWVKSRYELHLIDAQEVSGRRIAFYSLSADLVNRKAGLSGTLECERDCRELRARRVKDDERVVQAGRFAGQAEELLREYSDVAVRAHCNAACLQRVALRVLQRCCESGHGRTGIHDRVAHVQAGSNVPHARDDEAGHIGRAGGDADPRIENVGSSIAQLKHGRNSDVTTRARNASPAHLSSAGRDDPVCRDGEDGFLGERNVAQRTCE